MLRFLNHGEGLFPAVIKIEILIEHTLATKPCHFSGKQPHFRVLIGAGIIQQLLLHIPAIQFGIAEPREMIQSVAFNIQRTVWHIQDFLQLLDKAAGGIADTINIRKTAGAQCLCNDPAGIGEIKNEVAWIGNFPCQRAVIHQGRHGTDSHGKTAGAGGLLPQHAVRQTGLLVKKPARVASSPDGGNDIIRPSKRTAGIRSNVKGQ